MRKTLLLIAIIFFTTSYSYCNEKEIVINKILHDLELTIKNSQTKNEYVQNCYNLAIKCIKNGEVTMVHDSTLSNRLYGCCAIATSENLSKVQLKFGNFILDTYPKHPSIVQAILIHEFQHIYDLKTKPELFKISFSNQIEKLYFDIDALLVETMFINDYLKPNNELSPFEKYLCSDLKNNMASVSTLFENADINLVHQMDALDNSDQDLNKTISELVKIGKNLLIEYDINNSDTNWTKYCNFTTLNTFNKYYKQALYDIVNSKSKKTIQPNDFNIEDFPQVLEVVESIKTHLETHIKILQFKKKLVEKFENYYH
ncbi:hypothetical protein [Marinifilum caeruleilacunae]|uniref:Peptidase M48 domain-containing protein n=1 Tax=Marinifilum caeruleilacunae TaxID=2499076 RepID=A0ABX1X122_9BACT|nr:hypothetical protein [Marinifilum caeruleilacunae]NOU61982.1 hypothetical protein [Marinifilum caeruleilacunae]